MKNNSPLVRRPSYDAIKIGYVSCVGNRAYEFFISILRLRGCLLFPAVPANLTSVVGTSRILQFRGYLNKGNLALGLTTSFSGKGKHFSTG